MRKILFISLLVYLLFTGNTIALSQPKTPPALTHYKDSPPTSPTTTTLETLGQCYRHDVSSLSEQEDDSSRRLFMTGVISVGILAGMGKANAIMMDDFDKQPQQKDPLSSFIESTSTFTADAATDAAAAAAVAAPVEWRAILQKASKKALGGGKAGASAAVVQVCSLMWLRTSMNYQYRYGGNLRSSLKTLYEEGGIARLYQGLPFALIQGPMTRFGDTAANVGILAILESSPATQALPLPLKTACGSFAAGAWRIVLMPIDTSKTAMQVEGADGLKNLWNEVFTVAKNPSPLYRGALASAAATAAGHFPWFLTYNFLNKQIPEASSADDVLLSLVRAAFIGLCASSVSDICSNSLRVVKTTKQTAMLGIKEGEEPAVDLSYPDIIKMIIEKDGILGLLGRGLQTRLLTNAIQGAAFSVLWRYFQQIQS